MKEEFLKRYNVHVAEIYTTGFMKTVVPSHQVTYAL